MKVTLSRHFFIFGFIIDKKMYDTALATNPLVDGFAAAEREV
ncbi:hypothetical protein AB4Z45_25965 [Paenibacillus sp. MCAF9]